MKDPYIWTDKGYLTTEQSNEIIQLFESDNKNKYQGQIGGGNTDLLVKNSTDIHITEQPEWYNVQNFFKEIVQKALSKYSLYLKNHFNLTSFTTGESLPVTPENFRDHGFFIKRTSPGKGYVWHSDYVKERLISFILYLNTVEEGWTQFANGEQVAPELGKLLMFPATWSYIHQGYPPKQTKYIMVGWLYDNEKETN